MINEHVTEWLGLKVSVFDGTKAPTDYRNTVHRLVLDYDDERQMEELLAEFLSVPASQESPGLIIGSLGEANQESVEPVIEALVAARDRLPNLRGLFFVEVIGEENEISWIQQGNISPLFGAYPKLEQLRIRGSTGLEFGRVKHDGLRALTIETGGLEISVVRDVLASSFPLLEHLEIWLGSENYGWDGAIRDLRPLYAANPFPKLRYLGIRNCEIADVVAEEVVISPIMAQLDTLDLSLGMISDRGGKALLASPAVKKLKHLSVRHNYFSDEVRKALMKLQPVKVDASRDGADKDAPEDERYVAVSE
jgi:hypothetical protein